MKALPGSGAPTRRDHLRAYLLACLRDNVLSPGDLLSVRVLDRLSATLAADIKAIAADVLSDAKSMALGIVGMVANGIRSRVER